MELLKLLLAKTKVLISFAVTAFGFAYPDCLFSHKVSHMVIHRRAILALNLSFLNRLHLSKVVLKCAAMFEFRLSVLVNSYGYVGMLPPFYRTSIQHSDVRAPKICLKR